MCDPQSFLVPQVYMDIQIMIGQRNTYVQVSREYKFFDEKNIVFGVTMI